jgi:hypothetical protein
VLRKDEVLLPSLLLPRRGRRSSLASCFIIRSMSSEFRFDTSILEGLYQQQFQPHSGFQQ